MILDFGINLCYFVANTFGGLWNLVYKVFVPKKRRNPKLIYRKKKYRR